MKIVYSYYKLDIIHAGHLQQMRNAKALAGKEGTSIVGILLDEVIYDATHKYPILDLDERLELARAIRYNDFVVTQDTYSPIPNLMRIKPDIHMESDSHDAKLLKEVEEYMKKIGGRVIITPYFPRNSSSRIKEKIKRSD